MAVQESPSFGMLLRQHRVRAGLTQEALAARAGLSLRGLSDLERGARRAPYPDTIQRLAAAIGLSEPEHLALIASTVHLVRRAKASPRAAPLEPFLATPRSRLVGREPELAQLLEHLEAARAGRGGVMLIAGEPGIGKTRLVRELAVRAASEGSDVLVGRAYESDGVPPYLPFIETVQDYVRAIPLDQLRVQLGDAAPEVALLVHEVHARLPELPASIHLDLDQDRFRLFEGFTTFLLRIAHSNPRGLVVCLDDLQWADKPTLLLLQHLARRLTHAPLLVVGTYRTVDLDRSHPLADVLAELSREHLYQRRLLSSLSRDQAEAFIEALNGAAAAPAIGEAIYRGTEGNPFFVEEVVHHLREEGRSLTDPHASVAEWGIPEGLRQVIGKRLSRLGTSANRLLHAAAVLGEGFTFEVLAATSSVGPQNETANLLDALDEVLSAGLIREEGKSYHFIHALVRQAVAAELSLPRKQRLHLQAAHAIERIHARNLDSYVAELAYHFSQAVPAGAADRALLYAKRAGDRARAVFAYEESARLYEMALEALESTDAPSPAVRCDLLLSLAEALGPAGEPQRLAENVAEEAFTLAEALGDGTRARRSAHLAIVEGLRRYGGGTVGGSPLMRHWVERLDRYAVPDTRERVEADFWMGIFLLAGEGRWADGWARIDNARNVARQLQDAESLAFPVGLANWYTPRRWEEGLAVGREMATLPLERVSTRARAELLNLRNWTCLAVGDRDGAEQTWRELADLSAHHREASLMLEPLSHRGSEAMLAGDLEDAVGYGERIITRADELGSPVAGRQIAYQVTFRPLLYLGRADEALAAAFAARRRGGWSDRPAFFRVGERALCLAWMGRSDQAQAQLTEDLASVEISADTPVRILAALLETASIVGDRTAAALLAPLVAGVQAFANPLTSVALPVAEARILLGDATAARAHCEQALDWSTRLRCRPEIARARLVLAELLFAEGADAFEHLDFAIKEFRAMNMQPCLERALRLHPRHRRTTAVRGGTANAGGLSARELEVLRLVADGNTNRDIANALVISLNTVIRHVSSIFVKTGTANRAEAASWAVRHGVA